MKVIENPVKQIEYSKNLSDIQIVIGALMKSLKNIYDSSNFYKEARIVSFVDRLLESIISKIKTSVNFNISVIKGMNDY